MSEVVPYHSVEEAPFINGLPQVGDRLVSFREPGIRGIGMDEAAKALRSGFGEDWRENDLTDDDKRRWKLGELFMLDAVVPKSELIEMIDMATEIDKPKIHGIAEMKDNFVAELRKMLGGTEFGVEINPLSSQLMRLLQIRYPEETMYELFSMAHGPVITTPNPSSLLAAAEERGHVAQVIGRIIEDPLILIHSTRAGNGDVISYDV